MFRAFEWSQRKNIWLLANRNICFEQIVSAIETGKLLDIVEHPKPEKYARQRIIIVELNGYAYLVPFIEQIDHYFLKTIIPSRKATRRYLKESKS